MSDTDSNGSGRVPEDVIAARVYETASRVIGVYGLTPGMSPAALTKNLLKQDKKSRGVYVTYDEETGYTIDVYLIVRYGVNIPETAWNVQKRAFDDLKNAFEIEPKDINIHVQGVRAEQIKM